MDEQEPTVVDLGMGWSRVTEQDGAVFYWHEASEQSQWEPPPSAAAASAAEAVVDIWKPHTKGGKQTSSDSAVQEFEVPGHSVLKFRIGSEMYWCR
jgi:hypothetical protein